MTQDPPATPASVTESGEPAAVPAEERRIVRLNLWGFAAYCLVVFLIKWTGFSAALFDHAKEIYHAQELRWIYDAANPPLYTWLLYGLQQLFGARLATVLLLNNLLLFLIFASSFALARRVLGAPVPAALAAWSLMLVGQYHKFLYTMSHSLLVAVVCPLLLWILLRIAARRRLRDYVIAGLVLGLGLLSKFLFLATVAAAVLAALASRAVRPGVLHPKVALAFAVGAAVFVPFVLAAHEHWSRLTTILRARTGADAAGSYLSGVGDGLLSLATSVGEYGLALAVVAVLAIVWAALSRRAAPDQVAPSVARPDELRFVGSKVLAGLGLMLAAVLVADVHIIKPRFMHVFFFPLPILAVALVMRHPAGAPALRRYAVLLGLIGAGILAVRAVNSSPVCLGRCEDLLPVDRLAERLTTAGFRRGTILAHGVRLGGNLVLQFPGSRVDVAVDPFVPAPPPAGRRGQCLIVWEQGDMPAGGVPPALVAAAGITAERARAAARSITLDWRWHGVAVVDPMNGWRPRRTTWRYVLLPAGTETCR